MLHLKAALEGLEEQLQSLNILVQSYVPEITLYRPVTIPVKFDNAPQCFDHIVSWSYSLIFESLAKHYDFLLKQALRQGASLSSDAIELKQSIHYLRTYGQHSQFEADRLTEFFDYRNSWFQRLCGQNEPISNEEWIICIKHILNTLVEVVASFERAITEGSHGEFSQIFRQQWLKLALRTFAKHEYEAVLISVLENHGLSNKIDPQLFSKRYLTDWQRGIDILPDGFDFKQEAYSIIHRSIAKEEIIPINGPELVAAGIPTGPILGKCINEARKSFYNNPCTPEELISRMVNWYSVSYP